jgi:exosortase A-associated hydrolase 2
MSSPVSFYLPGTAGNLFAMYYPPAASVSDAANVLYVHPFAGEMLTSRNVIAGVSRQLSGAGLGVLVVDLYGCGDSSGDFAGARWEVWLDDLRVAVQWLQEQGGERLSLWGLRLGALLAIDFAVRTRGIYEKIVLWQPVLSGEQMLNQFLHMNLSSEDGTLLSRRMANRDQRKNLLPGEAIEVAGYSLASELMWAIDKLALVPPGKLLSAPIHWIEFTTSKIPDVPTLQAIEDWKRKGARVTSDSVVCAPFWLFPYSVDARDLAERVQKTFMGAENG